MSFYPFIYVSLYKHYYLNVGLNQTIDIDIMTGIWSTLDILTLLGQSATTDFEFVTELSESNTTHPLLQTVADGRAGVKFINIF